MVGILTIFVYLTVVVFTTPALEPLAAVNAAFQLNAIVIIGMGIGIGIQTYLSEKSKMLGCKLNVKKKAFGGSSGSAAVTGFFSLHLFDLVLLLGRPLAQGLLLSKSFQLSLLFS